MTPADVWAHGVHAALHWRALEDLGHEPAAPLSLALRQPGAHVPTRTEAAALDASAAAVADLLRRSSRWRSAARAAVLAPPLTSGPGVDDLVALLRWLRGRPLGTPPLPRPARAVAGPSTCPSCGETVWWCTSSRGVHAVNEAGKQHKHEVSHE